MLSIPGKPCAGGRPGRPQPARLPRHDQFLPDRSLARPFILTPLRSPQCSASCPGIVPEVPAPGASAIPRRRPAPRSLHQRGNAWLDGLTAAVLCVPSALVSSEHNFLLNPRHPGLRETSRSWSGQPLPSILASSTEVELRADEAARKREEDVRRCFDGSERLVTPAS